MTSRFTSYPVKLSNEPSMVKIFNSQYMFGVRIALKYQLNCPIQKTNTRI